jgi:hypothetical protein
MHSVQATTVANQVQTSRWKETGIRRNNLAAAFRDTLEDQLTRAINMGKRQSFQGSTAANPIRRSQPKDTDIP